MGQMNAALPPAFPGEGWRGPSLGSGQAAGAEEFPLCSAASWNLSPPYPLWERGSN